jgi:phosphoribosylanthranilate isomerase
LAGGLTADNISEAIKTVQPWGVDSNTGTNIPGDPVLKDWRKVEAFLTQARQAASGVAM